MCLRSPESSIRLALALVFVAASWLLSVAAHAARPAESSLENQVESPVKNDAASREYVIQPGDTLLAIAVSHGLKLSELLEANGIKNPDKVQAGSTLILPAQGKWGKVTKAGVVIEVPKGFSLSRIAAAYDVRVRDVLKANKLENANKLRAGQKLLIPGAKAAIELVPPPPCYKPPVTLYRVRSDDSQTLPLCFCDGRPTPAAIEAVSRLSSPPHAHYFELNARLVELLQAMAEQFKGHRIELISGYRQAKQKDSESRHTTGDAIDFRLLGVSNKDLSEALRRLSHVGVGYYPNSVFVHLDVRETAAYWIDYSRPGEKAIYGPAQMSESEIAAIRERRTLPVEEQLSAVAEDVAASIAQSLEAAIAETAETPAAEKPAFREDAPESPVQGS